MVQLMISVWFWINVVDCNRHREETNCPGPGGHRDEGRARWASSWWAGGIRKEDLGSLRRSSRDINHVSITQGHDTAPTREQLAPASVSQSKEPHGRPHAGGGWEHWGTCVQSAISCNKWLLKHRCFFEGIPAEMLIKGFQFPSHYPAMCISAGWGGGVSCSRGCIYQLFICCFMCCVWESQSVVSNIAQWYFNLFPGAAISNLHYGHITELTCFLSQSQ